VAPSEVGAAAGRAIDVAVGSGCGLPPTTIESGPVTISVVPLNSTTWPIASTASPALTPGGQVDAQNT
jgi:hypothetical protein